MVQIEGLALRHQDSMQLFALFNILDISLTEKKLVLLLCELSRLGVCIVNWDTGLNSGGWRKVVALTEKWLKER